MIPGIIAYLLPLKPGAPNTGPADSLTKQLLAMKSPTRNLATVTSLLAAGCIAPLQGADVAPKAPHSYPAGLPIPVEAQTTTIMVTREAEVGWIHVTDFGAQPDDGKDDTKAFQEVFETARKRQNEILDSAITVYIRRASII